VATHVISSLAAGTEITMTITFTVDAGFQGDSITNYAEISQVTNTLGLADIDSTPDDDWSNDVIGGDNVIDNSNGDEDDHDPETISIGQFFDLSLIKVLNDDTVQPVPRGGTVLFDITVINQGTLDATQIQVNDYIPEGLILDDENWTETAGIVTLNTPIPLLVAGESITVSIRFTVDTAFVGESITNDAEIASALDGNGEEIDDIDSHADDDDNDTVGGDNVTDNSNGDEDDHDQETIILLGATDKYRIGSHFWIDKGRNNNYDGPEIDQPISGAVVELFDAQGLKIAETTTDIHGEYGFDVDAGSYYVVFNIPTELQGKGYVFVQQGSNENNNINISVADLEGRTSTVTVGPNIRTEDLTRDAALYCACADIESDSMDALNNIGIWGMILMVMFSGLFFVRRENI